ncbi:alpha 1-4-glycosyltransferase family [Brachionus plicatilis]|uniref:Alpha 1-4-glycosyltransferase family n=1 Tax=Brachionus plicatilis TaxID=10195 RepID=A0A3M7P8L9_BRAPC|nr:alpha 1-4-glycosyltransferase family [Brachionus plicatilis]
MDQKDSNDISLSSCLSHVPSSDKFHIFLIWRGSAFSLIYQKAFETVVKFHPNAEIMLFSNELKEDWFLSLNKSGNVFVVRYNLMQLVKGRKGWNFAEKASRILNGENVKNLKVSSNHLSNFLRLFLLYTFGGLYLDTDMIVLRDLSIYKNHIGVDDKKSYICSSNIYSAKGAKNFSCLCNCLLSFEKNHPFIGKALDTFESHWSRHQGYGSGGATMLISIIKDYLDIVNVIPNYYWICNKHLNRRFSVVLKNDSIIEDVVKNCFVLHLYGAGHSSMSIDNFENKLAGRVWNSLYFD